MGPMFALCAGLTTLDVLHALDHVPDPTIKVTSTAHLMAAGGPATNAAVTIATLARIAEQLDTSADTSSAQQTHRDAAVSSDASNDTIALLSAIGTGVSSSLIARDLHECGVTLLDATPVDTDHAEPAVSSIIEHPEGRMVASTNARLDVDTALANEYLATLTRDEGDVGVVLIDGHNPALADMALRLGVPQTPETEQSPFDALEMKPSHLRILDGGSWKPWLSPLLGFVDVAVVSADFCPPILPQASAEAVAAFLRGFGITRGVRTRGSQPVQWWWNQDSGEVNVPQVNAVSTLGAGDVFHGAFAWAMARLGSASLHLEDPTEVIRFASEVAAASTTEFGTRSWRNNEQVRQAVRHWLQSGAEN